MFISGEGMQQLALPILESDNNTCERCRIVYPKREVAPHSDFAVRSTDTHCFNCLLEDGTPKTIWHCDHCDYVGGKKPDGFSMGYSTGHDHAGVWWFLCLTCMDRMDEA